MPTGVGIIIEWIGYGKRWIFCSCKKLSMLCCVLCLRLHLSTFNVIKSLNGSSFLNFGCVQFQFYVDWTLIKILVRTLNTFQRKWRRLMNSTIFVVYRAHSMVVYMFTGSILLFFSLFSFSVNRWRCTRKSISFCWNEVRCSWQIVSN